MSVSSFTLIGLGLCVMIVLVLCLLAVRRFDRMTLSEKQSAQEEDVLELNQLSFDQIAANDGTDTVSAEPVSDSLDGDASVSDEEELPAPLQLAEVEFGVRPDTLVLEGMRQRLEYTMALLNRNETTLISIRVSSDLVIYNPDESQATRPSGPTLRQHTLARLDQGERIIIQGDWKLPDGLEKAFAQNDGKGVYLLARARIVGANVAPKSQYFLIGHLLPDSKLVPICNAKEAFTNLGVTEAKAPEK